MQQEDKKALKYHSEGRPGKIEVIPTKPLRNHEEIALAYSPGAITPAIGISKNIWNAYKYTNKGNLVAIISNGSNISEGKNLGAAAAKPHCPLFSYTAAEGLFAAYSLSARADL